MTNKPKIFWRQFWARMTIGDDCWLWTGPPTSQGYGSLTLPYVDAPVYAHRLAYTLWHAEDPGDFEVRHSCHTPLCVRPLHLSLGTHADNMNDLKVSGRGLRAMCHKGLHDFTLEHNIYRPPDGSRECAPCRQETNRIYNLKQQERGANA